MRLFVVACALATAACAEPAVRDIYTPVRLFDGADFSKYFYTFIKDVGKDKDPKHVFSVKDGEIVISGQQWGCLTTKEVYSRYHLIAEWKWGAQTWGDRETRARDNGLVVHSIGEDGGYSGTWMNGIECQIIEGGTGDLLVVAPPERGLSLQSLFVPGEPEGQKHFSVQGKPITLQTGRLNWWGRDYKWEDAINYRGPHDVENMPGEWNRYEAVVDGPNIRVYLNGALVNAATDVVPAAGKIQIQSEGAEIHFRRFDLYPIWSPPPAMKRSRMTADTYTDRQGNALTLKSPEDWAKFRERMRWNMSHICGPIGPPPAVEASRSAP